MFFSSDRQSSPYDLNFRLFDVPVRVEPWFWLITLLLGAGQQTPPAVVLMWVAAVFISILIHEMGHVLAFRHYGIPAHIVLHSGGGLAIPNYGIRLAPRDDIVVSFAGPFAGFLFAAVITLGLKLSNVDVEFDWGLPDVVSWNITGLGRARLHQFVEMLFFVNIYWGLVNLLPIYPLDGGRISRAWFEISDPRGGLRTSLIISIVTAVAMAFYGLRSESMFFVIFFGYFAYQSYQQLQDIGGGRFGSRW